MESIKIDGANGRNDNSSHSRRSEVQQSCNAELRILLEGRIRTAESGNGNV